MTAAATALEIAAAVHSRRLSARDVTERVLQRIRRRNPAINAFTAVTESRARAEADAVDAVVAAGGDPGPLAGAPYSVKNLFDLAGEVTVAGSKINRDLPPASRDATSVARLKAAGAICVGAVNMGEYAYDFTTENAHDGPTRNPHDLARSAGGSSGGSGACVAAGLVPFSLGTDTNGSIRVPSSFCGLWGLKPTYSRLSRAGGFLFVESLDTIGPLARSVADLAAIYDTLQGPDPRDPVCTPRPAEFTRDLLDQGLDGLRIGVLDGYFERGGVPAVHDAVQSVATALRATQRIELPVPELARAAAFLITASEAGNLHLSRLRQRAADFDPGGRDRFLAGALTPSGWYLQAQRFRAWWRERMRDLFSQIDVLIAPATPLAAPMLGQQTMTFNGRELPLRPNIGVFTQPITLIGLPVVAAPIPAAAGGLPVAVQLIAAPWREAVLLRVARALEKSGVCSAPIAAGFAD